MICPFKQILGTVGQAAFDFELVEGVAQGKADQRVVRANAGLGDQVGRRDRTDVACRIEHIPEREGGRQSPVEELLSYGQVHEPEGLRASLGGHGRTDEVSIQLDSREFPERKGIIPGDLVIGAGLVCSVGLVFILYFIMIQTTVHLGIPPTGGL